MTKTQRLLAIGLLLLGGCHWILPLGSGPPGSEGGSVDVAHEALVGDGPRDLAPSPLEWATSFGSGGDDDCRGVAVHPTTGASFVAGTLAIDASDSQLTAGMVVAAFSGSGQPLWSGSYGGPGSRGAAVAVTGEDVLVAGEFLGTIDLGGGPLTAAGTDGIAALLTGKAGDHVWSHNVDWTGDDHPTAIAASSTGAAVVTGFARLQAVNPPPSNMLLAAVDASGMQWHTSLGAADGILSGYDVALDPSDNIYVTGHIDTQTLGCPTQLQPPTGAHNILVASFDSTGTCRWEGHFGGTGDAFGYAIAVGQDDVYVTGMFSGTVSFGTESRTATGYSGFLLTLDRNGAYHGVRTFGGPGTVARAVALDPAGNACIAGSYEGAQMDLGSDRCVGQGKTDAFAACFDKTGPRWLRCAGSPADDMAQALAIYPDGSVALTGTFSGAIRLAETTLNTVGGADIFLARLRP